MNLWMRALLLPVTAFGYSLEFMVKTLQAVQQTAQQLIFANPNTGHATTILKEAREMSDCCSSDQCGKPFCEVRVYDYYIVSVKPCHEKIVLNPTSIVITSDMSGEAFTSYVMALFCQDQKLPPEEIKYLRVCYRISCTFPKERESCSTYAREQVEVLRQIRDAIGGMAAA
jgi:hypothetical protein